MAAYKESQGLLPPSGGGLFRTTLDRICHLTGNMHDVNPDYIFIHKDESNSRQALDAQFEDSLAGVLKMFRIFYPSYERDHLINVVIKDKDSDLIKYSSTFLSTSGPSPNI